MDKTIHLNCCSGGTSDLGEYDHLALGYVWCYDLGEDGTCCEMVDEAFKAPTENDLAEGVKHHFWTLYGYLEDGSCEVLHDEEVPQRMFQKLQEIWLAHPRFAGEVTGLYGLMAHIDMGPNHGEA